MPFAKRATNGFFTANLIPRNAIGGQEQARHRRKPVSFNDHVVMPTSWSIAVSSPRRPLAQMKRKGAGTHHVVTRLVREIKQQLNAGVAHTDLVVIP